MNLLLLIGIFILICLFSGLLFNKLKLPRTTGYIAVGFILSTIPGLAKSISPYISQVSFYVTEFAVSILLFEFGLEITRKHLQKLRGRALKTAIIQSTFTFASVLLVSKFLLKFDLLTSMLLATFAVPTAPDIVMFVLKEARTRCEFNTILEEVVLFDDFIAELLFFLIFPFFKYSTIHDSVTIIISKSIAEIGLSIILGVIAGIIMTILLGKFKSRFQTFALTTGLLSAQIGLAIFLHLHSIIVLLVSGIVFSFTSRSKKDVAGVLSQFDVLAFVLFLLVSGFSISVSNLNHAYLAVFALTAARFVGKVIGGFWGFSAFSKNFSSRLHLGLSLVPQSTIGIYFVSHSRPYLGSQGSFIFNITMVSIIFFELLGSYLVRYATRKESLNEQY